MLKIKDSVELNELVKYGFVSAEYNHNKGREWHLKPKRPFRPTKIWVDKNRILHFCNPSKAEMDLIYKMHSLLELVRSDKE